MTAWRVKFLDMSKYQGAVNMAAVAAAGYSAVVLRVSAGATYKDEKFHEYYDQARAAGLRVGGYFVVNPLFSALAHWANFAEHLGGRKLDLPVVADSQLSAGLSNSFVATRTKEILDHFEGRTGELNIIYTAAWFWDAIFGALTWPLRYLVWVAIYPWLSPPPVLPLDARPSRVPKPWIAGQELAWQWTDRRQLPAITASALDDNVGWTDFETLIASSAQETEMEERIKNLEADIAGLKHALYYDPAKKESNYITSLHHRLVAVEWVRNIRGQLEKLAAVNLAALATIDYVRQEIIALVGVHSELSTRMTAIEAWITNGRNWLLAQLKSLK